MEINDIDKAQGAKKLLRQWDTVKRASAGNPPTRIVLQAQGPAFAHAGNMVVTDSDPEFAALWTLLKAVVDRKHAAALTDLATFTAKTEAEVAQAVGVVVE